MPIDDELLLPTETEVNFEKDTLYNLYQTGGSREINPERWDRVRKEIRFEDVVADLTGHSGSTSIRCPFHGSDSRPSFWLYKGTNDGWCFGCLEENEPIWTVYDGLKPLKNVRVGDRIYDRYGQMETVLHREDKEGELLAIETHNFRAPLLLTPDHTCLYVREDDAVAQLPYIHTRKNKVSFDGGWKRTKKLRSKAYKTPITEARADSVKCGDYILFPLIEHRSATPLLNPMVRPYTKGTVPSSVPEFPVGLAECRLYGLYIAEGSTNPTVSPRTVRWTFHINEAPTFGKFVQDTLLSTFNLNSTLFEYPEHHTCEVVCSSVELARGLAFWFGSGAENKKIPAAALSWPVELQAGLVQGYLDGDGEEGRNRCVTVSSSLAYSIWALGVQSGALASLGSRDAYIDKKGVAHRKSWVVSFNKRESLRGFFQEIEGHQYYGSKVSRVAPTGRIKTVVDIIVSGSESFLTKLGAVHNCPPKEQYYDHVRFVAKFMEISRPAALRWLEKKWDLPPILDTPEEEEEGLTIKLRFEDLQEPYMLKAIKQVQEFKDVELAEDYLQHYFKAVQQMKFAEDVKKQGEGEDAIELEAAAATTLARVLGKGEISRIFERKQISR